VDVQKPLKESIKSPEFFITDFGKMDRLSTLHAGFQAISTFSGKKGCFPLPRNKADAAEVVSIAKTLTSEEVQENILEELSFQAAGDLSPMNAVIGGFVAQEALKACSSKFHPMLQHMYFDALECLPKDLPSESDCAFRGSRYDGQIAVFGHQFQTKLQNCRQFLVGAGAIGCEMLKNWSMMGLGCGPDGVIHLTDLDTIEKSNLNRQFLFRSKDLGKFKSDAAAAAIVAMNPDMHGHVHTRQDPVGPDTEGKHRVKPG
jgi:ubiquitin-activating enzyme E1